MLKKTLVTKIFAIALAVSLMMPSAAMTAFAEDAIEGAAKKAAQEETMSAAPADKEADEVSQEEPSEDESSDEIPEEVIGGEKEETAETAEAAPEEPEEKVPAKRGMTPAEDPEPAAEEKPEEKGDAYIGEKRFEKIQDAIDAASDGDTIELKADFRERVTVKGKSITIDLGGNTWKAQGGSYKQIITVEPKSEVTIKNGTVTGGKNLYAEARTIVNKGLLTIKNVKFTKNSGGLIYSERDLVIEDSDFYGNDLLKSYGGQQYLVHANNATAKTTIRNTVFRDNDRPNGGIIYAKGTSSGSRYQSDLVLEGCDIIDNVIGWYGSLDVEYGVTLTLDDTTVKGNRSGNSQGYTGGLYCYKIKIVWKDSAIYNNKTYSESQYANDIYFYTATSFEGDVPLPENMSDHGKKLTGYRLMELSYNYEAKEPLSQALISKLTQYYRDWTVVPDVAANEEAVCEYDGKGYTSIEEAAAAVDRKGATITLLKDAKSSDKITDADDLTIDLNGYTLTPKNKSGSILQIAGKKVTVKNGTLKGCESRDAALHSNALDLTVENVDFIDNADAGIYQYHQSPLSGTDPNPATASIKNCKFIRNGLGVNSYNPSALQIVATTTDVTGCTFDGNRAGLRFWESFKLDNSLKLTVKDTSFTNHTVRVMELGVPGGSLATFDNVTIENNKVDGSYDALCYFKENGYGANTHAGDIVFNNSTIKNNEGAKYTVRINGGNLVMNDSLIQGNVAGNAGAIYTDVNAALTLRDTVIKENKATETSYTCSGGIALFAANVILVTPSINGSAGSSQELGFYASGLNMQGGALYNNSTNMASPSAEDLFVSNGCKVSVPKVSEFVDGDKDFSGLQWKDDATGEVVDQPNATASSKRYYMAGAKKIVRQVYVNGVSGDDENEGTKSSPVKTIEKANELADTYGAEAILVLGTVTYEKGPAPRGLQLFDDEESKNAVTIDVGGKTIKRDPSLTKDPLITIADGADVTMKDTTMDGNSKVYVKALASLVKVEKGGKLTLDEGSLLESNGYHTSYINPKGGAVLTEGELVMKDGAKICRNYAITGGGICVDGGEFRMEGGTIEDNTALWRTGTDYNDSYGGGVCIINGGSMLMEDGLFTLNEGLGGGGAISLGTKKTTSVTTGGTNRLFMLGGTLDNNKSYGAGGGIYVQCSTEATISGGYITNNIAEGKDDTFAGGGIYVNGYHNRVEERNGIVHGKLYLMNVELARNTAYWEGGAIAVCGSGTGHVNDIKGTVIYDNDSLGKGKDYYAKTVDNKGANGYDGNFDVFFDDVHYEWDYSTFNWIMTEDGKWPVLASLPGTASMGSAMLNGARYNWEDENGNEVAPEDLLHITKRTKLTTDATSSDTDVQASVRKAKVHILGNTSQSNGGGIGSNGEIYIGQLPDYKDIPVEKKWEDDTENDRPAEIKVWLLRDGKKIESRIISADEDGNWKTEFTDLPVYAIKNGEMDKSHKYEYTVKEDLEYKADGEEKAVGEVYEATAKENEDGSFTLTNKKKPEEPPEEPPKEEPPEEKPTENEEQDEPERFENSKEEGTPKLVTPPVEEEEEDDDETITGKDTEKNRKFRTPPKEDEDEEEIIIGSTEEKTPKAATPKTGDSNLLALWIIAMITAAIAIAVLKMMAAKRK